ASACAPRCGPAGRPRAAGWAAATASPCGSRPGRRRPPTSTFPSPTWPAPPRRVGPWPRRRSAPGRRPARRRASGGGTDRGRRGRRGRTGRRRGRELATGPCVEQGTGVDAATTAPARTQVAIVGAGPAGLVLAHLLGRCGIDCVVLEARSRDHVEHRVRAGVLEHPTVQLLCDTGVGDRLRREGLEHGGISLRFDRADHRLDFVALTGRSITVYGQQEVVKDLIAARLAAGGDIHFEVGDVRLAGLDSDRPEVAFTGADGVGRTLRADVVAGCDGFHGVSRPGACGSSSATIRTPGSGSWPRRPRPSPRSPTPTATAGSPWPACGRRRSPGSTSRLPPTRTSPPGPTTASGPSSPPA